MAEPVQIDFDNRRVTFQFGRTIPPQQARSHLHRLLDHALDALAGGTLSNEEETGNGSKQVPA